MTEPSGREAAYAKINLFLHVTGRRDDGYHLLDSLAVFAEAADVLSVAPAPALRLSLSGPFAPALQAEGDDNLVLRAARGLIAPGEQRGAHLTLDKRLPVASGIGGGSADAAAALRLLHRFWSPERVDRAALHALAARLGADVPVCLDSRTARMQGTGEILRQAPRMPPSLGLVLVNCGEAVSTQTVFRARAQQGDTGFRAPASLPPGWDDAACLSATLAGLANDLEAAARRLCPGIDTALAALGALPGCRLARMSGSGATCFGLFDNPQEARAAAAHRGWPQAWWVWAGGLRRDTVTV